MLLVLAGWCFWGAVFVGIGRLISPGARRRWQDDAVAGLSALLLALQVWQLFLPVATIARCTAVVFAVAGFVRTRQQPTEYPHRALFIIQSAVGIGLAWLALGSGGNGDSGLYHRQVVRWFEEFRLVPGLNVLSVAPINSAHFLYIALLEARPWTHVVHHVAASLLVAIVASECLEGLWLVGARRGRAGFEASIAAFSLPLVADLVTGHDMSSDSPDLAVTAFEFVLVLRLVRCLGASTPAERRRAAFQVSLVAAATLILKPATAGMVGAGLLVLALTTWRADRLAAAAGISVIALASIAWCVRDVVLTGYPLYPLTWLGLPVDWRISMEMADRVHRYIVASARWWGGPLQPVLHGWAWVGPWLRRLCAFNRQFVIPISLAGGFALLARIGRWRPCRTAAWLYFTLAGAAVFWLSTAPDLRFAGALFWLCFAVAASDALVALSSEHAAGFVAALALALAGYPIALTHPPQWTWLTLSPEPAPRVHDFMTKSGLRVRVADDLQCWDADPPCLPFPLPGLRERTPGKMRGGFAGDAWNSFDPGSFPPLWWDAR